MADIDKKGTEQDLVESRTHLVDLTERAAAKDAVKDFEAAAELYSQATELQAELNGELSVENADLLFAYGKSLYNVAVGKSDVLGSKVAGEQPQAHSNTSQERNATSSGSAAAGEGLIKNAVTSGLTKTGTDEGKKDRAEAAQNQPYFQFAGDENFEEPDSEDDEGAEKAGADEDDDDFANAFEVLDMARILYKKKLGQVDESEDKGKSTELPADLTHIRERLADTYDLQAEISLEAERFTDAVTDLTVALEMKQSLYPVEDPSVAECHYKLSLALEFASVNKREDSSEGDGENNAVDEKMRKEAAHHMEAAIESCKIRMTQEQKKLDAGEVIDEDKIAASKRKIANVKDIIADMEQRVGHQIANIGPPSLLLLNLFGLHSICSLSIFAARQYRLRNNRIKRMSS